MMGLAVAAIAICRYTQTDLEWEYSLHIEEKRNGMEHDIQAKDNKK
jgi:hypothetical protein